VGTPIARLVKTDPLRLRLDVPERESGAIRTGLYVRVVVEGDTNVYSGRIARVAPALREADRSGARAPASARTCWARRRS
jgi:hypothetical protein